MAGGAPLTWRLDRVGIPFSLEPRALLTDLQAAVNAWGEASGLTFHCLDEDAADQDAADQDAAGGAGGEGVATITFAFADRTPSGSFVTDGRGGALAACDGILRSAPKGEAVSAAAPALSSATITFDESERWETEGGRHPKREMIPWEDHFFHILPVALHELGHALGLSHSSDPADVMSPYYDASKLSLTDNDKARVRQIFHPQ